MENNNNVYKGIFGIVIVGVACFATYLGTELKNSKINIQTNEVTKTVEKGVFVPFDATKKKFISDSEYSIDKDSSVGCKVQLDSNGKVGFVISSDAKNYFSYMGDDIIKAPLDKVIEVTGFTKKVVDVFIGGCGQGVDFPIVLFLMEDGTVEYLDSKVAIENNKFVSAGKLENVENIVRFERADAFHENIGGYITVIAIDKDGYFYDVGKQVYDLMYK